VGVETKVTPLAICGRNISRASEAKHE